MGSRCGNETLSAIGADIGFGDYTLSSAFSNLDTTDGSDMSVWSLGVARTYNEIDYTVGYTQETLSYARDKTSGAEVEDQSTILMLEAVKPLGDGVDLGLNISNTENDIASEDLEMDHKMPGVQVFLLHSASNQVIPLKNTKI